MSTISQAHSDAARTNGAKSQGPVTPDGKARSSQNARTHGLTSQRLFIAPEDKPEFQQLLDQLKNEIKPKGILELTAFDQLIFCTWKLRNLSILESELAESTGGDPSIHDDPEIRKKAAILQRYRTTNERARRAALRELRTLQNNRLQQEQFSHLLPENAPPLSDKVSFTSRTQANLKKDLNISIKQAEQEAKTFSSQIQDLLSQFRK
jgi:hypothetical protein